MTQNYRSTFELVLTISLLLMFLQAQPATPPSAQDTVAYLNQTIDWYRHLSVEEGVAVDSADIRFLNDDRQVAKQILFNASGMESQLANSRMSPLVIQGEAGFATRIGTS